MCDTVVVTAEATLDGVTLFGKNSDREPNEAHLLELHPARDHSVGSRVRLTYVEIPQAMHTYRVVLAKPFNIWGAEMGANEHGLVIGNEALFTRVPYEKGSAPTGMDLLRLALERSRSASEAVEVITGLLAEYGQGGNCGYLHPMYYHNSFLLADPKDAWVLETAGKEWAAKQVRGVYTISNGITLTDAWDMASENLVNYAVERGWCKGRADFDFARCYSDAVYTRFSDCRHRCERTRTRLEAAHGRITAQTLMDALRDHGERAGDWQPGQGLTGAQVCMHAGFGPVRINQTTGSMVSALHSEQAIHFFTATAAPCTSVFKPVWLDAGLPDFGPPPTGLDGPHTLFWRHERLHRLTLRDYHALIALYCGERDRLEAQQTQRALDMRNAEPVERLEFSQRCFDSAAAAEAEWLSRARRSAPSRSTPSLYQIAWNGFNRQAQLSDNDLYGGME